MTYLFNNFSKIALMYKDMDICDLYNRFLVSLNDKETQFVSDKFMLFIKTAEAARNTIPEIQNKLLK